MGDLRVSLGVVISNSLVVCSSVYYAVTVGKHVKKALQTSQGQRKENVNLGLKKSVHLTSTEKICINMSICVFKIIIMESCLIFYSNR